MPFVSVAAVAALLVSPTPGHAAVPSFRHDVAAVLARAGCSAGACHGNLNGRGGLRLSLRSEDPDADYRTLTRDALGRRISPDDPAASLLLRKAAGQLPHEGGVRFAVDSHEYRVLRDWIAAGARPDPATTPALTKLAVTPDRVVRFGTGGMTRITAAATFADGTARDVTRLACFEPTKVGVVRVLPNGEVVREADGEVVVLVRYLGVTVPVRLAFLPDRPSADLSAFDTSHPIDKLAAAQWAELRIRPADRAGDGVFLRRAMLDACGQTPTADEARVFLADARPDKRARLVDDLLARPAFAAYWAQKWGDLLRNEEKTLDRKGVQGFHRWLKDSLAADRPLTHMARDILAGRGGTYANPPANFYRAVRDPYQRAESVAQVFLGLRVGCAKCHNHPFDAWTQDDYHRFVAAFARIKYRVIDNDKKDKLDKHEFVGDQVVYQAHDGELPHPRGGTARPRFLGSPADVPPDADRLRALADWVAAPANPFFAKAQANRVWFHLLGQGLVDAPDDFRASNPPSNPALLDHLAAEFARGGYKLKPLVRHILTSRVYELSAAADDATAGDDHHFARAIPQPLEAEQLLDAVARVLDVPVKFPGYPAGTRAGEVPASPQPARRSAPDPGLRFLKVFGKPERLVTCECERSEDPGLLQAFQLMTGGLVQEALRAPDNRLGRHLSHGTPPADVLDELYLAALARFPTTAEKKALLAHVATAPNARAAWEDVAWGLLNAKEFLVRR